MPSPLLFFLSKMCKTHEFALNEVNCKNSICFSPWSYLVRSQRTIVRLDQVPVAPNSLVPERQNQPLRCPGKATEQTKQAQT